MTLSQDAYDLACEYNRVSSALDGELYHFVKHDGPIPAGRCRAGRRVGLIDGHAGGRTAFIVEARPDSLHLLGIGDVPMTDVKWVEYSAWDK